MSISLHSIPRFTAAEAQAVAERCFGIVGAAAELPSERDQNFLIAAGDGAKFVLKIANVDDGAELLNFQNLAMRRVAAAVAQCRVPQVLPTRTGADLARIHAARTGAGHWVRVLTWIEGDLLAKTAARGALLFESIGAGMGRIDAALRDFTHPAMHRILQWDVRHAGLAREHAYLLPPLRRARVERVFAQWEGIDWTVLSHGVIHGDANDYNVIVEAGRMVGLLDFGDMGYSATACDLAIALAYTMLGEPQPLAVAAQVTGAYHRCNPLTDADQRVLFTLILSRLAMSVCYSAHSRACRPHDPYQVVSEAQAWELLDELEAGSLKDAQASISAACASG